MPDYYIGLMSGTSVDAIDAGLLECNDDQFTLQSAIEHPIEPKMQEDILALCSPGNNEIERMGVLDNQLAEVFARASQELLTKSGKNPSDIIAIGCHGQTIRHKPSGNHPFTLQIGNPALISELTGITTVADFRRADMAAGGQGAPLAPAFHQAAFANAKKNRVVVNIGGMANISVLENHSVSGFDTGPGNVLINYWAQTHLKQPYDADGKWARQYSVNTDLLKQLLAESYFQLPPPKSTGRELFNSEWIAAHLEQFAANLDPGIVQATLTELTAVSISEAINQFSKADEVYVCGGGAYNTYLMDLLRQRLHRPVESTDALGVDPSFVEAAAFAWFAKQALDYKPANIPAVTGAKHPVVLGAIYPR